MELPIIKDIFNSLTGCVIFSTIDCWKSFHQFEVEESSREKTAFTHKGKRWQFRGAPFGFVNVPSYVQYAISTALSNMPFALVYVDDIVIGSRSFDEHVHHCTAVLERLNQIDLRINALKCHWAYPSVKLLGNIISPNGTQVDEERITTIAKLPIPKTLRQIQALMGMYNYCRDYIPLFSTIAAPLEKLKSAKDIPAAWTPEHGKAISKLNAILAERILLSHPDFEKPFFVATDASNVGLGAILYQNEEQPKYISIVGRALSKSERNYSATKKELLAIVWALKKFHHYLYGTPFTLYTDHRALTYMLTQKEPNSMILNWWDTIMSYNFQVVHKPGLLNILPDAISRLFPDKLPIVTSETDGTPILMTIEHSVAHFASLLPKKQRKNNVAPSTPPIEKHTPNPSPADEASNDTVSEASSNPPSPRSTSTELPLNSRELDRPEVTPTTEKERSQLLQQAHENGHF